MSGAGKRAFILGSSRIFQATGVPGGCFRRSGAAASTRRVTRMPGSCARLFREVHTGPTVGCRLPALTLGSLRSYLRKYLHISAAMIWPSFHPDTENAFLSHFARRFADLLIAQGTEMLRENGLRTPTSAVSTILYLNAAGAATVTTISEASGYTRQMAAQRVAGLEKEGLLVRKSNEEDRRSHLVTLTPAGRKEAAALTDVVVRASAVFDALFDEIDCNLTETILAAERRLHEVPLSVRMQDVLPNDERGSSEKKP